MIKNRRMARLCGLWVLVLLASCTTPNPRSCADGTCSDPALPFCDVDGAVAGAPLACIAVSCTPAEVAVCRGSEAVTCNSAGDNFELKDCPLGCNIAVGGCRSCATDTDCTTAAPICDQTTSQCRVCAADTECESLVCGQGACVDRSEIVYASSTGSNVANGTLSDPGSIPRALELASIGGGTPKIVRLLPGTYTTPLEVLAPTTAPLEIVATGATIRSPFVAMNVRGGADVKIRGISLTGGNHALLCGSNGDLQTTLIVEDSLFFENPNVSTSLVVTVGCTVAMTRVESRSTSTQGGMLFATNTRFTGDRILFVGRNTSISTLGVRVSLRLTNSVLDDVFLSLSTSDSQAPGSEAFLAFNTIVVEATGRNALCPSSASFFNGVFENNIIVANGATKAVDNATCSLVNNVLRPQPGAPAGNIVADPQFENASAKNFRLRATSPALGAASTAPLVSTDHDFLGAARPQGAGADLGAFEQ